MIFPQSEGSGYKTRLRYRLLSIPSLFFLAIAVSFLYFLVVRFNINPSVIGDTVKDSNPWLLLLAFVLHYTSFIFRGAKWRLLLRSAQDPTKPLPSVGYCSGLIFVSWFVNSVTVFRLGDAYRAYTYSNETRHNLASTFGTLLADRVVDVLLMFSLLVMAGSFLLASGISAPWLFLSLASILPIAVIVMLASMRFQGDRILKFLPARFGQPYLRFHQGALNSFSQLPVIAFLGILGWFSEISRLFMVGEALGFSMNLPLVIFATLANAILTLLPIGGLGITEFGVAELLTRSLTRSMAGSVVVVDRAISYLSVIILGGFFFVLRSIFIQRRYRHTS